MILFINCGIKLKRYTYYVHSLACESNKSWIVFYVTIRIMINILFASYWYKYLMHVKTQLELQNQYRGTFSFEKKNCTSFFTSGKNILCKSIISGNCACHEVLPWDARANERRHCFPVRASVFLLSVRFFLHLLKWNKF